MLRVVVFLLLLLGCCLCVAPSPSCPPGVKNCVPPSPASATVVGEYPIEVTSSLAKDTWKKHPFGAATVYEVSLAADSAACGTCSSPSSITVDQHGLVTSCTSTPPSPAAGFYGFPSNLLVSSEGLVQSVDNSTSPTFENITAEVCPSIMQERLQLIKLYRISTLVASRLAMHHPLHRNLLHHLLVVLP